MTFPNVFDDKFTSTYKKIGTNKKRSLIIALRVPTGIMCSLKHSNPSKSYLNQQFYNFSHPKCNQKKTTNCNTVTTSFITWSLKM